MKKLTSGADFSNMLLSSNEIRRNNTVFINPNFKAAAPHAHINPNFLQFTPEPKIHVNPEFLQNLKEASTPNPLCDIESATTDKFNLENKVVAKIISKSKTKLIRHPASITPKLPPTVPLFPQLVQNIDQSRTSSVNQMGYLKLIRTNNITNTNVIQSIENLQSAKAMINTLDSKDKYKIDRRTSAKPITADEKTKISYHSRYALKRSGVSPIKKNFIIRRKSIRSLLTIDPTSTKKDVYFNASVHKKLELLNINGVLYKSTRSKLQRKDATNQTKLPPSICNSDSKVFKDDSKNTIVKKSNGDRILFVRGNKFILDKNGFKLTRSSKSSELMDVRTNNFKRIDLGGLTYIAKNKNVFIRTDNHVTRNHLSAAKNKSINVLTNRLVKSNIPCQIYRKLGKCLAFEKGKCVKVHDKSQISICTKFLKGECNNINCLLSHNVSLSKMPVCKFFLQGLCSREDCPYLHKKLNKNAEICLEFLKGFCKLAEKCNKRHEYLCPDYVSKGKCEKIKCLYCVRRETLKSVFNNKLIKKNNNSKDCEIIKDNTGNNNISDNSKKIRIASRYFVDKLSNNSNQNNKIDDENVEENNEGSDEDSDEDISSVGTNRNNHNMRPKLGVLPSFIPL